METQCWETIFLCQEGGRELLCATIWEPLLPRILPLAETLPGWQGGMDLHPVSQIKR